MAKRRRLPDLADDHRCTRNGTNWRCHLPRLPNKSYCQKHHLLNLTRSQSNSKRTKTIAFQQNPNPNPNPHSNLREIWAFHQPPSNCPDLYARIDRLIPSKWIVEVTPLIPIGNLGCGFFRVSEMSEGIELGRFSHRVWFEMEGDMYKIFPRKGEVWVVERYGWVDQRYHEKHHHHRQVYSKETIEADMDYASAARLADCSPGHNCLIAKRA